MVEGYEWVFVICFVSMAVAGMMVLYEIYSAVARRLSRGGTRDSSPRSDPRARAKMYARVRERGVWMDLRRQHAGR
jgi:hypothetical protein